MKLQTYSAVLRKDEGWWIGWVEEIPGVNSQGKSKAELLKNLRSALREALDFGDILNSSHERPNPSGTC